MVDRSLACCIRRRPVTLPLVLAVGHEFQLGSYYGPPLAFWFAEIAFDIAGTVGVYLLAQACVVLAYYAVFTLARGIVGIHHAAFAVLLMVGISAFTAPTPNFGPAILAMPFTAFALLNLWRAVGEHQRSAWFLLALDLGLLLLTTYAGLVLAATILVFLVVTRRGRRALRSADPWLASMMIVVVLFPHLIWLDLSGSTLPLELRPPAGEATFSSYLTGWLGQLETLFLAHAGLVVLVALGSKWHLRTETKVPVFVRSFTDPFGRRFVYFFAVLPALTAASAAVAARRSLGRRRLCGVSCLLRSCRHRACRQLHPVASATACCDCVVAAAWRPAAQFGCRDRRSLPWLGVSGFDVARPDARRRTVLR